MRRFILLFVIHCLLVLGLSSCIEDYQLPSSETEGMVVIFGQIIGDSDCTFTLRSTCSPTGTLDKYSYINEAKVCVRGTDGQLFEGQVLPNRMGQYVVRVGTLKHDVKYYVSASTPYGDFESEPMAPLDAPELTALTYEQPREDREVDILISTEDPQRQVYLLWQMDEYWEIYTPFKSQWECRIKSEDEIEEGGVPYYFVHLSADEYTNHGWRHNTSLAAMTTNANYGQGAIEQLHIYSIPITDHRLQTRYLARIRQMAITREEYEYRKQLQRQTSDVGGLFSQMPSELPSNIRSNSETRALGYIGVRGNIRQRDLYIDGKAVGYRNIDSPETIEDKERRSPEQMLIKGYQVYSYNEKLHEVIWTYDWCVDYRARYWGGTEALTRPDFWRD